MKARTGITMACVIVGATIVYAWPARVPNHVCPSPEIRIFKREGELDLMCSGKRARTMAATFGGEPKGTKEREGDQRTPEGWYRISSRVENARFHRFLGVSYPNDRDQRWAQSRGVSRLGSGIGIHGTSSHKAGVARIWGRFARWTGLASVWGATDGCVLVANEEIEHLFKVVPAGAPVLIAPSRS